MLRGLVNGERIWWSLDTRTLSVAIDEANKKLEALQGVQTGRVSVDDAVERFMRDKIATSFEEQPLPIEEARSKSDTIRKLDDLLSQLKAFALQKRIRLLEEFKTEDLSQFRETWRGAYDHQTQSYRPKSLVGKQKYKETLKSFFKFAHNIGWISQNPASKLSPIRTPKRKRRAPHSPQDIQRVLVAIEPTFPKIANKVRAFFLILCSTGMRIGDVVCLERSAVTDGKILFDTGKTDAPIYTKLPPIAVEALASFVPTSSKYFFWTGNGKLDTAKADWSERMLKLYRAADVAQRSHAFRDTLTTAVLGTGGHTETAAKLLGHRDIRITQAHYEHWDSERQKLLDEALVKVWGRTGLVPASSNPEPGTANDDLPNLLRSAMLDERVPKDAPNLVRKLLETFARNEATRPAAARA
ncbi:MAG TPA: tyrosine-type recombinase/integrase [Bryobacteraceae bacterium]|jgi:integrase|nr:tyrosine-type recombinase/integrase [Bryobacteraceae bacterium]